MNKLILISILAASLLIPVLSLADNHEEVKQSSAANAALSMQPAIWQPGWVTQMSVATRMSEHNQQDNAIALSLSRKVSDNVLFRLQFSRGFEKEVNIAGGSISIKWGN